VFVDGGRVEAVCHCWPGECVIFGNGDEFCAVRCALLVGDCGAFGFVSSRLFRTLDMDRVSRGYEPKGIAIVSHFELHLLVQWEVHRFIAHDEHILNKTVGTMIF
jgi:hypothetical protein